MKSELRIAEHSIVPDAQVVEVWYGGELIATVTGADAPGVRVISKHKLLATPEAGHHHPDGWPAAVTVQVFR
jgi:hypothetical protein